MAVPVFEGKKKKKEEKKRFAESNLATKRLEWPGDEPNAARIYMHLRFIVAAGRNSIVTST